MGHHWRGIAQPQAERWKRDRKSMFRLKVATDSATGTDEGRGPKRRGGSNEQIKTVRAGPTSARKCWGLVGLCPGAKAHQ